MKLEAPFGQFPLALLEDPRLDKYERYVWIVLETWTDNDSGTCHPSIPGIAERAGLKQRTTRSALQGLADKGWLRRTVTRGARTRYTLFAKPSLHTVEEPGTSISAAPVASLVTPLDAKPARRTAVKPLSSTSAARVASLGATPVQREKDEKCGTGCRTSAAPVATELYSSSRLSKEKERERPNPLFELEPKPDQTPKHASIDDLWQQQQLQARPESDQEPEQARPGRRPTARQEQARAKAAADCTYREPGHFLHLGPVARAWIARRNPEGFKLNFLIDDDFDARQAADPLSHVLELLDEQTKLYRADKAKEQAKEQAVLAARKLERRQKFEDKRSQERSKEP